MYKGIVSPKLSAMAYGSSQIKTARSSRWITLKTNFGEIAITIQPNMINPIIKL